MSRHSVGLSAAAVAGVAAAITSAPAAQADPYLGNPWGNWPTPAIGANCNQTPGNNIRAVQQILMVTGSYHLQDNGRINGYWSSETQSATKAYQQWRGLAQDGCVGEATWTAMAADNNYLGPGCSGGSCNAYYVYRYAGREFSNAWVGSYCYGQPRWTFQDPSYPTQQYPVGTGFSSTC